MNSIKSSNEDSKTKEEIDTEKQIILERYKKKKKKPRKKPSEILHNEEN